MHVQDDLYTGNPQINLRTTNQRNPTQELGVGPLGRVAFHNIVPVTLGTALIAALQASTISVGFTLTAGAGVTTGLAPDGSGRTVLVLDVPRSVSLTSASNLSVVNYTIVGWDQYGQLMTVTRAGPNANTVGTLKAFKQVLSVTPSATNAFTASVGIGDVFGLPFYLPDIGYLVSVKWAGVLASDAGTAVIGDATSPATAATGDVRGTYQPSSASNGTRRLVIAQHLDETMCGSVSNRLGALGVTQA